MFLYLQMIEGDEDKTKFVQLYERYSGFMFAVAHQVLNNDSDAEDAVHQAFLSVIKNLKKVHKVDSLETKGYLAIITERKAIDIIRKNKKYVSLDSIEHIPGIEITISDHDTLADAMSKLPGHYREVLLLRYYHGYTAKEIGELLDASSDTIQKTLWRAKQALRQQLQLGGKV